MERVVVETVNEQTELVKEWDSLVGARRGPDGGLEECSAGWSKAFEKELDLDEAGVRGGGAGADAAAHAGLAEAWERACIEWCRQVESELVARMPSRFGVKGARVELGEFVGEHEKDMKQEVIATAWNRDGRIIGRIKMMVDGGVRRVLQEGMGRTMLNVLTNRLIAGGTTDARGVVLGA